MILKRIFFIFLFCCTVSVSYGQLWSSEELKYINAVREQARISLEDYRQTLNFISHKQFYVSNKNLFESWRTYSNTDCKIISDLNPLKSENLSNYIYIKDYLELFRSTFEPDSELEVNSVFFNDLICGHLYGGLNDEVQIAFVQQFVGVNKINGAKFSSVDRLATFIVQKTTEGITCKLSSIEPCSKAVRMRLMEENKAVLEDISIYDKGMETANAILNQSDSAYYSSDDYKHIYEYRIKAKSVIIDFETALNSLFSDAIESSKIIADLDAFADTTARIIDDLKPGRSKNKTELLGIREYLNRFRTFFIPDTTKLGGYVKFDNFIIGREGHKLFDYIPVIFTSRYYGRYNGVNEEYKTNLKYATLKISIPIGTSKPILRIIDIRFANQEDSLRLVNEDREYRLHETAIMKRIKSDQLFDSLFVNANEMYLSGRFDEAIRVFELALTIKPEDVRTNQVVASIKEIIRTRDRYNNSYFYLAQGDSLYKIKQYEAAIENYERTLEFDSENGYAKNQISILRSIIAKRNEKNRISFLAVNYSCQYYDRIENHFNANPKIYYREFSNPLNKVTISYYRKLGFYIGGIKYQTSSMPNVSNSLPYYHQVENTLNSQGISYTPLKYYKTNFNLKGLTSGLYYCPFRPLYLKVGLSYLQGSVWDEYTGNLLPKEGYSFNNQKLYAADKSLFKKYDLNLGLAIVLPFIQFEFAIENRFNEIDIAGGINIPFRKFHGANGDINDGQNASSNELFPTERKPKKFPHRGTTYLGFNYDFIDFSGKQISNISLVKNSKINEATLERFGISIYSRFGIHISQIRFQKDEIPGNFYTEAELLEASQSLISQGITWKQVKYKEQGFNGLKFCFGLYYSLFRPVHFLVGFTGVRAKTWDVYNGDYSPALYPNAGNGDYYLNFKTIETTNLVGGVAFVFPGFQTEIIYDGYLKLYTVRAGINLPFVKGPHTD